jgi:hypothetical protein
MDRWLALGPLLAGCRVGALLTAAVCLTQLKELKTTCKQIVPVHKADRKFFGIRRIEDLNGGPRGLSHYRHFFIPILAR